MKVLCTGQKARRRTKNYMADYMWIRDTVCFRRKLAFIGSFTLKKTHRNVFQNRRGLRQPYTTQDLGNDSRKCFFSLTDHFALDFLFCAFMCEWFLWAVGPECLFGAEESETDLSYFGRRTIEIFVEVKIHWHPFISLLTCYAINEKE